MRVIPKNANEELHVGWADFAGRRFLDVRIYVLTTEGPKPTRKGVAVPLGRIRAFSEAVAAEAAEVAS